MKIQHDKSLFSLNTFGIDVSTRYFVALQNVQELSEILNDAALKKVDKLILGGGSNVLFTSDYDGLIIKNNIKGIEVVSETDQDILLRVGAGENWHSFVMHCVEHNYSGIENLSLIPGNVGASPMQNIGAYGVEVKNVVEKVEYMDLRSGELKELLAHECEFGYRSSIFKTSLKGKALISHVTYRLSKIPELNTSYGAIEKELERMGLEASVVNVSKAVINIRRSKLPDPNEIGNAGSFFKNPVVDIQQGEELKKKHANLPMYPAGPGKVKLAAGWLIEQAGWKGKRINGYGVHVNQALVLVNYGQSSGSDINDLADEIRSDIHLKFGIDLEKEVNVI